MDEPSRGQTTDGGYSVESRLDPRDLKVYQHFNVQVKPDSKDNQKNYSRVESALRLNTPELDKLTNTDIRKLKD